MLNEEIENKEEQEGQEEQSETSQDVLDVNAEFDAKLDSLKTDSDIEEEEKNEDSDDDKNSVDDDAEESKEEDDSADNSVSDNTGDEEDGGISQSLLQRAEKAGLSIEQAENFSSSKDLESALGILEARQDKKEPEEKSEGDAGRKPFDCGLSKDIYDDDMVDAFNKLGDSVFERIEKLEKEKADWEAERAESREAANNHLIAEHTKWLDGKFNALEDFDDVFGSGDIEDIDRKSVEFKNRASIDTEMATLLAGYQSTNRKIPSKDRLFEMAINNLHGKKVKQSAINKTGKKLKKRAGQAIGRSTRKTSATQKIDKALQANLDFDSKHGL